MSTVSLRHCRNNIGSKGNEGELNASEAMCGKMTENKTRELKVDDDDDDEVEKDDDGDDNDGGGDDESNGVIDLDEADVPGTGGEGATPTAHGVGS